MKLRVYSYYDDDPQFYDWSLQGLGSTGKWGDLAITGESNYTLMCEIVDVWNRTNGFGDE